MTPRPCIRLSPAQPLRHLFKDPAPVLQALHRIDTAGGCAAPDPQQGAVGLAAVRLAPDVTPGQQPCTSCLISTAAPASLPLAGGRLALEVAVEAVLRRYGDQAPLEPPRLDATWQPLSLAHLQAACVSIMESLPAHAIAGERSLPASDLLPLQLPPAHHASMHPWLRC